MSTHTSCYPLNKKLVYSTKLWQEERYDYTYKTKAIPVIPI